MMMVRHIDKIIGTILVVFTLIAIFIPVHGDDIPSGVVAVFPDSEPTGEEDLGPEQHGSVDHDNSNLTIDFGFYVPTPTPASTSTSTLDVTPTPTPTSTLTPVSGELDDPSAVTPDDPSVVTLGDPPISEDSLDQVSTGARHFGKRREEVGLRKPCVVIPAEIEDPWFVTDIAMYAASEMYRTGQPFLKWAEENGLAVDQQLFSPTGVREFGAEILEFSLDNINTVMTNSGLGLHWKYAPFIAAGAKAKGVSPESYLEARLQEFARKSNLKTVPRNVFPIFIEYAEGDPRYTKSVNINNWETLLWNDQSFEQSLIPSAYGQTLLRQVLSLKEFLAARHDRNGQPSASGEFLGVDDARGFIGVMTAEAIVNKLWFMATELIHYTETDGGKNIPYFPYQTVVHPGSEEHRINIVDEQSRLFDQLSLLWALSELMQITDPKTPGTYQQVFMQELLAPGVHVDEFDLSLDLQVSELSATSVYALASRLAAIVFNSLLELHYVAEIGTLLDVGVRDCAGEMQEDSEQATPCTPQVSTTYLGLTLTALERYYQVMKSVPGRQEQIGPLIRLVAEFLFNQMYDNDDGGIFDSVSFSLAMTDKDRELKKDDSQKSLDAQMAAMRGLLAAYSVTGDLRYRTRAFEIYRFAEESLWNENLDVYKDQEKRGLYRYTPLDVGTVIGALRELIYQSEDPQQTLEIMKRMKTFVKQITKYAGLQLSEIITSHDQMFLIPVDNMSVIRTALSLDSPFGLAPVLGSEIVLNKDAISALHAKRPTDSCEEARNAFRSTYYYTDIGMYAATELGLRAEGGRRKAEEQKSGGDGREKNRNPELLNLGAIEQTVATSRDFSDLNLVHIQSKSALGVHLKYGPFIQQQAQQAAMPPEDYLNTILQKYAELAGLETVPEHLEPIFIEYEGGVPEVEYGTRGERWLDSNMDTSILPSALGQALRREVLWIRDVLSDRHDERNRLSGTGQYPGRNAEEGFLGLLVAQEVANKILFLYETMQAEAETTPSGYYFPHEFKVDFDGEKPQAYIVEDGSSYLFDQVSLLWGLSEFERVADPKGGALYSNIFGQGQLISGDFHRMAKELVQILLQNLETLHWNSKYDSLYELNHLDQQEHTPATEDEAKGEMISTHMAAMAIIALESVYHNFADTPAIQAKAKSLLLRQVEFLTRHLYREEDGAMYNGAALADEVKPFTGLKTLLAHAAAIRSYLIAYQITGDLNYLNIANRIFEFLDKTFWDARLQIYRSALGGSQYQYTPLNVAMTVGAFRELLQVNSSEYLERIHQHFSKFFEHIVERTGLQLSEQQYFLELLGQSRTLAPVFASDLTIQPVGSSVDAAIPQPGSSLFYTIQVTDEQLGCDIENAYIEDVLPEGVTFVRSDPLPESVDGRVIRWWVADLTPNDDGVYTLQIEVQINPFSMSGVRYDEIVSGLQTWHVNNCASLWCRTPGVGNSPMTTDCVDDEIKLPRLGVEKSLRSLEIEPGKDVEFEIGVMNLSEVTAYTITVEDQNPDGLIYLKNSERSPDVVGVELDDTQPLVWVLEDLEPGRSIRLTYKVHLDPQLEEGLYTTTVKVHAMDRSGFPFETNEFKLDVRVGREIFLNVTQDFLNEEDAKGVWAGKPFSVLNTLENVGSEGLTECTLLVTLPEDFSYIPESSLLNNVSIGKPIRDGQQLTWKLGELLLSDRKTLQYTLEVSDEIVGTYMLKTLIKGTTSAGDEFESPEQKFEVEILR